MAESSQVGEQIDACLRQAQIMLEEEKYAEAENRLNVALQIEPDNYYVLYMLTIVQYHRGDVDRALGLAKRALAVAKSNFDKAGIYRCLAYTFLKKEDYQFAIEYFNKTLEVTPRDVDILRSKAAAHAAMGKIEEALEGYQLVLTIGSTNFQLKEEIDEQITLLNKVRKEMEDTAHLQDGEAEKKKKKKKKKRKKKKNVTEDTGWDFGFIGKE